MSMIPSPSTSTTIVSDAVTPESIAMRHLEQAQDVVLEMWSGLTDLDGNRAARLLAAHRAICDARSALDRASQRSETVRLG